LGRARLYAERDATRPLALLLWLPWPRLPDRTLASRQHVRPRGPGG